MKIFTKSTLLVLGLGLSLGLLLSSCNPNITEDHYTTEDNHEEYHFNYTNYFYDISPGEWVEDSNNSFLWGQNTNAINANVIDNGFVLFYYRNMSDAVERWRQMPSTEVYHLVDDPSYSYSLEFHPSYDLDGFEINYVVSSPEITHEIDYDIKIKMVVIDNSYTRIDASISHDELMEMINSMENSNSESINSNNQPSENNSY